MRLVLLGLIALAGAGCATEADKPSPSPDFSAAARQCFQPSSINSYRTIGEEAVVLRVAGGEIWRLDFEGSCPNINFAMGRIGVQQRIGGQICRGYNADVVFDDGGFPRRCSVRSVRRLNQTEIAALPSRSRP